MIIKPNDFSVPGYTRYPIETLRDRRVSAAAKGALASLLTRPADWQVNATWIALEWGIPRARAARILAELESVGYAERATVRNKRGRLVVDWIIRDTAEIPGPEANPYDDPEVVGQPNENSTGSSEGWSA